MSPVSPKHYVTLCSACQAENSTVDELTAQYVCGEVQDTIMATPPTQEFTVGPLRIEFIIANDHALCSNTESDQSKTYAREIVYIMK